jgi:4-diphosphocytidyl-2-C-methyl-D-erythritol kinase
VTAVKVRVPGKVNLALRSGPRRPDGYHGLATVFMALSLFDDLAAAPGAAGVIDCALTGADAHFVVPGANLAVKAAELLRDRYGSPSLGVEMSIHKRIPVAGGMAGGSADAAAALVACDRLWELGVPAAELAGLAAELGADVPFALMGGCALGLGRGDLLTPVLSRGQFHWVLAFAATGLSTPDVFRRFDELAGGAGAGPGGDDEAGSGAAEAGGEAGVPEVPPALLNALAAGDVKALGAALVNDLERAAISLAPKLRRTLDTGLAAGALGAVVSGSGPTVALLAASEKAATDIAVRISSEGVAKRVLRAHGPVPGARVVR